MFLSRIISTFLLFFFCSSSLVCLLFILVQFFSDATYLYISCMFNVWWSSICASFQFLFAVSIVYSFDYRSFFVKHLESIVEITSDIVYVYRFGYSKVNCLSPETSISSLSAAIYRCEQIVCIEKMVLIAKLICLSFFFFIFFCHKLWTLRIRNRTQKKKKKKHNSQITNISTANCICHMPTMPILFVCLFVFTQWFGWAHN